MDKLLDGKVAIITGGSSGIGEATAELFAEHGAKLILTARGEERLNSVVERIKENGGEVTGVVADVTSDKDREKVFQTTFDTYGDLDVLVNNAGIDDLETALTTTDEKWDKTVDTNLTSVFKYTREALKHMVEENKGSIVNVSSTNGLRPLTGTAYSVTKHAVNSLTKAIALQTKSTNVRCNAVCPGVTKTKMLEEAFENPEAFSAIPAEMKEIIKRIDMEVPLAEPSDQANAILFFASEKAKGITGQTLAVDYGSYI